MNLHPTIAQALRPFTPPALAWPVLDDDSAICNGCAGSGEGMTDGSTCRQCKGSGEAPSDLMALAQAVRESYLAGKPPGIADYLLAIRTQVEVMA